MPWYGFLLLLVVFSGLFTFLFFAYRDQKRLNDVYRNTLRSIETSLYVIAKSIDK